jgi:hypothetical protein
MDEIERKLQDPIEHALWMVRNGDAEADEAGVLAEEVERYRLADTREARIIALEMAVRVAAARPQAPAHTNEVVLRRAEVFEGWPLR